MRRAAVDDDHVRPAVRLAPDDARRNKVKLIRSLLVAKQRAEARILGCVLARLQVLDAQLVDFTAEHLVLLMHCHDFPDVARDEAQLAFDPRHGLLERRGDGADRLGEHRRLESALGCKENNAENAHEDKEERPGAPMIIFISPEAISHLTV